MTQLALEQRVEIQVVKAAEGDREAFGQVIGHCSGMVSSIALAILRDFPASQDVSQEVFLHAWANLRKLRNPASFLPWIRQITRNRAYSWIRDQKRKRLVGEKTEGLLAAAVDPRPDAAATLVSEEDQRVLQEVIEQLPDEAREVVALYYREGQSARQVALLLGIREEAVRQRLSRARSRLRRALLERFGDTLARTAPGAAFTSAVLSGLGVAVPATSASAAAGMLGAATGGSILTKLATVLGTALPGAVAGLVAVSVGLRQARAGADDRERRQLVLLGLAASGSVLVSVIGYTLSGIENSGSLGVLTHVFFSLAIFSLYLVWLPRILARRMAIERQKDPQAAARQAKIKRVGTVIALLAWTVSTVPVIWGVVRYGW